MNNAKYTLASCFSIFSLIVVPIALFIVPIIYVDSWWLCVLVIMALEGLWSFIRLLLAFVLCTILSDEEQPQENFQTENTVRCGDHDEETEVSDPNKAKQSLCQENETSEGAGRFKDTEKQVIIDALNQAQRNGKQVASLLGMDEQTLHRKIEEYQIRSMKWKVKGGPSPYCGSEVGEYFYTDKALLTKLEDTERHNHIKLHFESLDPMSLLAAFPSLHIKKGFVLRAYPYYTLMGDDYLGGVGNVWAVPVSSSIPNPEECETIDLFELHRPFPIDNSCLDGLTMDGPVRLLRPPDALDNIMEAIEGDGTLDSYLSASIFAREIAEYGADCHGVIWSEHTILVGDPWTYTHNWSDECEPSKNTKEWKWLDHPPSDWRPSVVSSGEVITVNFYTYSPLLQETIYRYTDLYKIGSYKFEWDVKIIAEGPASLVF